MEQQSTFQERLIPSRAKPRKPLEGDPRRLDGPRQNTSEYQERLDNDDPVRLLALREEWKDYAICKGMDQEIFFPRTRKSNYDKARKICAVCPVKMECREYGQRLFYPQRYVNGIWGGWTYYDYKMEERRKSAERRNAALSGGD